MTTGEAMLAYHESVNWSRALEAARVLLHAMAAGEPIEWLEDDGFGSMSSFLARCQDIRPLAVLSAELGVY